MQKRVNAHAWFMSFSTYVEKYSTVRYDANTFVIKPNDNDVEV